MSNLRRGRREYPSLVLPVPSSGKTTQRNLDDGRDKRTSDFKNVQITPTYGPDEGSRKELHHMRMARAGSQNGSQEKEVPNATEGAGACRYWSWME